MPNQDSKKKKQKKIVFNKCFDNLFNDDACI